VAVVAAYQPFFRILPDRIGIVHRTGPAGRVDADFGMPPNRAAISVYAGSQRKRKKRVFGWIITIALQHKTYFRRLNRIKFPPTGGKRTA